MTRPFERADAFAHSPATVHERIERCTLRSFQVQSVLEEQILTNHRQAGTPPNTRGMWAQRAENHASRMRFIPVGESPMDPTLDRPIPKRKRLTIMVSPALSTNAASRWWLILQLEDRNRAGFSAGGTNDDGDAR